MTRWAKDVSPTNAHPEYPRPQMVRKVWMSLNGLWNLTILKGKRGAEGGPAMGRPDWQGEILVPYPVESALSGVMQRVEPNDILVYRRTFQAPAKWKGKRVLLHFGAVDWNTTVLVNGKEVGTHQGGYDAFTFDITDKVKGSGRQELEVRVWDPSETSWQPHGKQYLRNEGIWYTPTSGIWQTVWLEPVPKVSIDSLWVRPSPFHKTAEINFKLTGRAPKGAYVEFSILDGNRVVSQPASVKNSTSVWADFGKVKWWSPESPFLYRLKATLLLPSKDERGKEVFEETDSVESYFAMREISLGKDAQGRTRIFLNGKPYFLVGPLDQGFWPDGLYTAPTDVALKYDLEVTKKLGFNFIRKHVKVEPDRWYYWCDKMGIAVFQDMPSGDKYIGGRDPDITRSKESAEGYERELKAMIETHRNHPCIVGWVPYNEGWGQWDTPRIAQLIKKWDPSRLVDSASGWTDRGVGDMHDMHNYPGPGSPNPEPKRAAFLGEFGGLGLPTPGHMWKASGWGYQSFKTNTELTDAMVTLFQNLRLLIDSPGLSGAVYTQTTDVETELNGFMTYDRAMIKPDSARVAEAVKALFLPPTKMNVLVPTSEVKAQSWAFCLDRSDLSDRTDPSDTAWTKPSFDDASWKRGPGGFGTRETPGAVVGTIWNTSDIWLRRTIEVPEPKPAGKPGAKPTGKELRVKPFQNLRLRIHHDEDAEVYLDGKLIASPRGYTTGYVLVPFTALGLASGKHTLAVHCHQTGGGQYIDVGIVEIVG